MPKYVVIKSLELHFECEAKSKQEAEELCIEADDQKMEVVDCQYEVSRVRHPGAGMDAAQLRAYFSAQEIEPQEHTRAEWREEVSQGNTVRGYWEWVVAQIEEHDHVEEAE